MKLHVLSYEKHGSPEAPQWKAQKTTHRGIVFKDKLCIEFLVHFQSQAACGRRVEKVDKQTCLNNKPTCKSDDNVNVGRYMCFPTSQVIVKYGHGEPRQHSGEGNSEVNRGEFKGNSN